MNEATAVTESSPAAPPVIDISRGPLVNLSREQRKDFRTTGELPKPKEASAPSPAQGDSEPPKQQEKPVERKKDETAEERISRLEAQNAKNQLTIERIRKGAGLESTPKAESAPAKPEAKPAEVGTKPKVDDKNADGSDKYATHEDFTEALAEWVADKRDADRATKNRQDEALKTLNAKLEEGRSRYQNLDEVITPAATEINGDKGIPGVIKAMIADSEVMVDLLYTIASDKADYAKFLEMAREKPGQAIRYISKVEMLIAQELEEKSTPKIEEPPAKPRTQAPKPPAEAGGRATAPPDAMQAAIEGSGGKLNASVKAEFLRAELAKHKA